MKKRVAFFVNDLYGGGAEKVLQTLLKHLNKEKFDVTLYSLHKEVLNDNYPPDITYMDMARLVIISKLSYISSFLHPSFIVCLFRINLTKKWLLLKGMPQELSVALQMRDPEKSHGCIVTCLLIVGQVMHIEIRKKRSIVIIYSIM